LENRRSKNDEVSRKMWEVVKTETGKVGLAKAKGGRRKGGKEKEMRKKRIEKGEEETKKPRKGKTIEVKRLVEEYKI